MPPPPCHCRSANLHSIHLTYCDKLAFRGYVYILVMFSMCIVKGSVEAFSKTLRHWGESYGIHTTKSNATCILTSIGSGNSYTYHVILHIFLYHQVTSYGCIIVDLCMISFNLNWIMQLKQFYNIATKVSSRKKCYYFWWSTWLLSFDLGNYIHVLRKFPILSA